MALASFQGLAVGARGGSARAGRTKLTVLGGAILGPLGLYRAVGRKVEYSDQSPHGPDRRIARIADRQLGNITYAQLAALGLSDGAIKYRGKIGRLFPVHQGVYAVGRPARTNLERAAAAVLACGERALLSHESALALWGIARHWPHEIHVTVVAADRRPRGVRAHRVKALARADVRTQLGIRCTSPARTLLDCAPAMTEQALTRAVNDAQVARLVTPAQLADVVRRYPNHRGSRRLTKLITDDNPTRSEFEDRFLRFCAEHGLPTPVVNATVCGYLVDALFEAERVIVELDGWDTHQTKAAFESDRERDACTLAAGFVTVRITWTRAHQRAKAEAARLLRILEGRR
jgi:predicted transcriptional regulator of viral defense system